jgi:hypothetical protein
MDSPEQQRINMFNQLIEDLIKWRDEGVQVEILQQLTGMQPVFDGRQPTHYVYSGEKIIIKRQFETPKEIK